MEKVAQILNLDIKMATTPVKDFSIDEKSLNEKMCFYTSLGADGNQALFLDHRNENKDLLSLRAHMNTGDFKYAKKLLDDFVGTDDIQGQSELLLEKARLAGFEDRWQDCIQFCELGLSIHPIELTQLCFLQCRAMALYELGHLENALYDCNLVMSQERLYPESVPMRYARSLRLKTLWAMGRKMSFDESLKPIWECFLDKGLDLDSLLTLLRLEIDIRRTLGKGTLSHALACFVVSQRLGDKLYEGLSILDISESLSGENQKLKAVIESYALEYEKVRNINEQLIAKKYLTTSIQRMTLNQKEELPFFDIDIIRPVKNLVLCEFNVCIDLETQKFIKIPNTKNLSDLSRVIVNGSVSKKDLFEALWKQKFSYEKHDGVVRTFLHRLKKNLKIPISSQSGVVSFPNTIFLN